MNLTPGPGQIVLRISSSKGDGRLPAEVALAAASALVELVQYTLSGEPDVPAADVVVQDAQVGSLELLLQVLGEQGAGAADTFAKIASGTFVQGVVNVAAIGGAAWAILNSLGKRGRSTVPDSPEPPARVPSTPSVINDLKRDPIALRAIRKLAGGDLIYTVTTHRVEIEFDSRAAREIDSMFDRRSGIRERIVVTIVAVRGTLVFATFGDQDLLLRIVDPAWAYFLDSQEALALRGVQIDCVASRISSARAIVEGHYAVGGGKAFRYTVKEVRGYRSVDSNEFRPIRRPETDDGAMRA